MARAKTPKQLAISIRSLKKKVIALEGQRTRAVAAAAKKRGKKSTKKRGTKKISGKRRRKR